MGVKPGGDIVIHGSMNSWGSYFPTYNWTWGCIGIRNSDMDELWKVVKYKTPIIIRE